MSSTESKRLSFGCAGLKAVTASVGDGSKRQRRQVEVLNYSHRQNRRGGAHLLDGRLDQRTPPPSPLKPRSSTKRPRTEEQPDGTWIWKEILLIGPPIFWAQDKGSGLYVAKATDKADIDGQKVHPLASPLPRVPY